MQIVLYFFSQSGREIAVAFCQQSVYRLFHLYDRDSVIKHVSYCAIERYESMMLRLGVIS